MVDCLSTRICQRRKEKQHILREEGSKMLSTTNYSLVTYPLLVAESECVKKQTLIDTRTDS